MTGRDAIRAAARAAAPSPVAGTRAGPGARLLPAVLDEADLDRVWALHRQILRLAPAGTVRAEQPAFFRQVIDGDGVLLGYRTEDGRLAAYGVLTLPAAGAEHYGRLLGLPPAEWPLVAQLEGVSAAPEWRGNRLQFRLGQWRMATAAALGRRHICATVAPANFYSWRTMLDLGLAIRDLRPLYEGADRYVMHRDLRAPLPIPGGPETGRRDVDREDLALQSRLLQAGAAAIAWTGEGRPRKLVFVPATGISAAPAKIHSLP